MVYSNAQHVQGALIPPFDTEAFSYAILKLNRLDRTDDLFLLLKI